MRKNKIIQMIDLKIKTPSTIFYIFNLIIS